MARGMATTFASDELFLVTHFLTENNIFHDYVVRLWCLRRIRSNEGDVSENYGPQEGQNNLLLAQRKEMNERRRSQTGVRKNVINEVRECIQIHAKMNDARITHIHYATTMLQNGAKFKI